MAAVLAGGAARAATLDAERKSDFFVFFQLAPTCPPEPIGQGRTWHCFRPIGAKFQLLVELAVLTDGGGRVVSTRLGLDRAFIDHPTDGVFARDIAKSFLTWAIPAPIPDNAGQLIANIGDLTGAPVLARAPGPTPPAPDTTGGYDVYLGRRDHVQVAVGQLRLELANIDGSFPSSRIFAVNVPASLGSQEALSQRRPGLWLAIDVTPGAVPAGGGSPAAQRGASIPMDLTPVPLSIPLIKEIQERLYELNYNPGPANGRMRPETVGALKELQAKAGLPTTGELNAATLFVLRNAPVNTNWAAVAFRPTGRFASVWRRPNRRDAEEAALRGCGDRLGRGCKVVTASGSRCIALAFARQSGRRRVQGGTYASFGATVALAQARALDYCRQNFLAPNECQVLTAVCADGSHAP